MVTVSTETNNCWKAWERRADCFDLKFELNFKKCKGLVKFSFELSPPYNRTWVNLLNQSPPMSTTQSIDSSLASDTQSTNISSLNCVSPKLFPKSSRSGILQIKLIKKDCFRATKVINSSAKKRSLSLTAPVAAQKRSKLRRAILTKLQKDQSESRQSTSRSYQMSTIPRSKVCLNMTHPRKVYSVGAIHLLSKLGKSFAVAVNTYLFTSFTTTSTTRSTKIGTLVS